MRQIQLVPATRCNIGPFRICGRTYGTHQIHLLSQQHMQSGAETQTATVTEWGRVRAVYLLSILLDRSDFRSMEMAPGASPLQFTNRAINSRVSHQSIPGQWERPFVCRKILSTSYLVHSNHRRWVYFYAQGREVTSPYPTPWKMRLTPWKPCVVYFVYGRDTELFGDCDIYL